MRVAATLLCLLPVVAFAQPREVATVTINNEEAKLFADGTWAFVNPDVTMPDTSAPRCIDAADSRISFCPDLAHLGNQVVTLTPHSEEHTFQTLDQGFTLVASYDRSYGHGGDLEYYRDTGTVGDGLIGRLASRALGLGTFTDQSFVYEDIAVVISQYAEPSQDYSSDTIEVLLENQSFYFDLLSVLSIPGFNEKPADFDFAAARVAARQTLFDSIQIDGQSLAAIIQEVQE